ncbi:MAG: hypothetical protein E7019_00370 [Alphaproteobacteria bacterium]|nr:hypothetical protein [Alphaproteobacteria bacterium]
MTLQHIIIASVFLICFAGSLIIKHFCSTKTYPSLGIFALLYGSIFFYALYANNTTDIISSSDIWSFYTPFGFALLYLVFFFIKTPAFIRFITTFATISFLIFYFDYSSHSHINIPKTIEQLSLIGLWLFLIYGLKIINVFPTQIYRIINVFGLGIFILSIIGATPFALGIAGGVLCATTLPFVSNRRYQTKPLSDIETEATGVLIGAFTVCGTAEASLSSLLIFLLPFFCESVYALIKMIFKKTPKKQIKHYTAFGLAKSTNCPVIILEHFWTRNGLMALLLGCFQAFAPNNYSLFIFCSFVILWQQHRITNWQEEPYNLVNTTAATISSLKENTQKISNLFKHKDQ